MPGSPGAVTLVYSGANQTGDVLIAGGSLEGGPRYHRWYKTDMHAHGAVMNVRSLTVFANGTGIPPFVFPSGTTCVILFSMHDDWGADFAGEFVQFTNAHPEAQWDVNIPDDFYWYTGTSYHPKPQSMLVLPTQRRPEIRISFRDVFLPNWNAIMNDRMPDEVILKGDPQLRWMAFPRNVQHLNEDFIYLYIKQEIEIDFTNFWSNYKAWFAYWLHLHLNDGVVSGHVARRHYWIEGGPFTSVVEAILDPNVELGELDLEAALNQALAAFPQNGNITGLYYLPGRQLTPVPSGTFDLQMQDADSDATVVFET